MSGRPVIRNTFVRSARRNVSTELTSDAIATLSVGSPGSKRKAASCARCFFYPTSRESGKRRSYRTHQFIWFHADLAIAARLPIFGCRPGRHHRLTPRSIWALTHVWLLSSDRNTFPSAKPNDLFSRCESTNILPGWRRDQKWPVEGSSESSAPAVAPNALEPATSKPPAVIADASRKSRRDTCCCVMARCTFC